MIKLDNTTKAYDFRAELIKILPGYKWTVHRTSSFSSRVVSATGIQSSGFNRTSTIEVNLKQDRCGVWFEAAGYGYGRRSPVMGRGSGPTLARAIRSLQEFYGNEGAKLTTLERALEDARERSA